MLVVGGALITLRNAGLVTGERMSRCMANHVQGERGASYTESSALLGGKEEGQSDLGSSWSKIHHSKREEHSTSDFQTLAHLLKGNIGTGLLALPLAVRHAGVVVGGVGLFVLGVIASHCMILLLQSSKALRKRKGRDTLDYAETAEEAMSQFLEYKGIKRASRLLTRISGLMVNFFLIVTQFGFCCVYLVFIGDNVQQVLGDVYGVSLRRQVLIVMFVPLVIVACWIRNLDELANLSTVANMCILFSLIVILYDELDQFITSDPDNKAAVRTGGVELATYKTLPLFFGSVAFAFEGIGVVLPLENKMHKPQHAIRVVVLGMTMVTSLYVVFGVLGYLTYGQDIEASITLNLKSENAAEEIFFYLVKLYYAYAIFAGYLVQFYVPMDFLEAPLYSKLKLFRLEYRYPHRRQHIFSAFQFIFRTCVVLITGAIAVSLPDLGDLISLVGAFSCCALAFIIPPFLEILTRWPVRGRSYWWVIWFVKDTAIITMGIVGFLFGTYATMVNIVDYFREHY